MATEGFEGGQMPLQRRVPKRGFVNPFRKISTIVNVGDLEKKFDAGAVVDMKTLCEKRLVKRSATQIKILAGGALSKKLVVKAHAFSAAAKHKVEAVGGTIEAISAGVIQ
jgi:large subunit ribosomal protein L15